MRKKTRHFARWVRWLNTSVDVINYGDRLHGSLIISYPRRFAFCGPHNATADRENVRPGGTQNEAH